MISKKSKQDAKQTRDEFAAPPAAEAVKRGPALCTPAAEQGRRGLTAGRGRSTLAGLEAARPSSSKPLISEMRTLQPREAP